MRTSILLLRTFKSSRVDIGSCRRANGGEADGSSESISLFVAGDFSGI